MIWASYFLGQIFHILMKAHLTVRSASSPIEGLRQYLTVHWPVLAARVFIATMLFWLWWDNPQFLGNVLSRVGIQIDAEFPLNSGTAGLYGYFSDSVLDKVVGLIPGLEQGVPKTANAEEKKDG